MRRGHCEQFALSAAEAGELAELAAQTAARATDLFEFTSLIDARLEMTAKIRIVEHMCRVAYADGTMSDPERHIVWRIADLLHVPQGAYVNARLRARRAAEDDAKAAAGPTQPFSP